MKREEDLRRNKEERMKSIERWVEYIKNNPATWRNHHNRFINAQFDIAHSFWNRLRKQQGGKEKIIEYFGIKNQKLIDML